MKTSILCIIAAMAAAVAAPSLAEEAAGDWGGQLFGKIHVIFHIHRTPAGYEATTESPDQSGEIYPVASVEASADHLRLAMTDVGAVYDGHWDAEKQRWSGVLTQGHEAPLELTRLDAASMIALRPRRPQDVAAKLGLAALHSEEIIIANSTAPGVVLAGTLTTPGGRGPFPLAILIAGSGPQTRDEEVGRHKLFLVLADDLTRRGIAVFRYDKRGVGRSKGVYATATTADFASDADAVVQALAQRRDIDHRHIGLIGHSEGGAIAPMVAAGDAKVSYLVLMAGPGLRGAEMLLRQEALIARAEGASNDAVDRQTARNQEIFEAVIASTDIIDAKAKIAVIVNKQAGAETASAARTAMVDTVTAPWMYYFLRHDPTLALRAVHVPVLALAGSLDLQVPPAEDLAKIKTDLVADKDVTVAELPKLNHLFQTAVTGSPSEYGAIEVTIAPTALKTIGDWVVAHTR